MSYIYHKQYGLAHFLEARPGRATIGTIAMAGAIGISRRRQRDQPLEHLILQILKISGEDLERILVLVGHTRMQVGLEVGEHGKPDLDALVVSLKEDSIVGKRMIVEEHARRNVERDKHVD